MNILITGAAGFVGKNLTAALECIRDGRDKTHPGLTVGELYLYDIDSDPALLETACQKADFVFNLAGVNRPKNQEEFMQGNFGFASTLLDTLKKYRNTCPVMLSSSIQATMVGRYAGSEYGRSKKAGEELFFSYAAETGAKVLVYRFPNLFGKWCRPNYNSAVATFCYNYAHDLPITVNDPGVELELLYIDDLFKTGRSFDSRSPRPTTADVNVAFEILNYRYTAKLPTIVSSECVLDDLIQIDESLAGRIAERAKNLFELGPDRGKNYRLRG